MSHDHSHAISNAHQRPLLIAFVLTTAFMLTEVAAAFVTGSLALLSDAAHMFTDSAALAVSLIALRIAQRAADRKRTFGYYRLEILAAAFNAVLLLLVAIYILYEAYRRIRAPEPIAPMGMLIVATVGLVVNLISMRVLRAGSDASLNVKGAYLEVWSDMLGSIGVIVAAELIRLTGMMWIDSLIAAVIGLWVVPRTWVLLKEAINILLEGVPKGMDLEALESALMACPGVAEIHDLHLWSLTSGKHVLAVHVVADLKRCTEQEVLAAIKAAVEPFDIHHTTAQVEEQGFDCKESDRHIWTNGTHS
jgi:cobalt-zinc-cadmium efflux system protein